MNNKRVMAYIGIFAVVLLWGIYPITIRMLYDYYSATILKLLTSVVSTAALLLLCRNKRKLLNRNYFKVAVPCGIFYALGELLQTIGFQYTTPTTGSFLENLCCITVPILMYLFVRQKPTPLKLISIVLCILSAFLLSMTQGGGTNLPIGILLCALAGILYGVNLAGTGVYAKTLDSMLYVLIQMVILTFMSGITTAVVYFVPVSGGAPLETFRFSTSPSVLVLATIHAIVIFVVCWVIRTESMKYVDATVVAVIMPFCSVITGILSLLLGKDTLTPTFIAGAILGLFTLFLSGIGDSLEEKKNREKRKNHEKEG